MKVLVIASTFPASDSDPVPAFVRDQVVAMKKVRSKIEFSVLAPHDSRARTQKTTAHEAFTEHRFHYFLPRFETLAGRGIMPAIQANPLNYFVIPFLFAGEIIAIIRRIKKDRPDIIYAHWFTPQVVSLWCASRFIQTPFVFTTHASDVSVWSKIPFAGGFIVRAAARKALRFTAVSTRSMTKLAAFFSEHEWSQLKERSAIIPMGIDTPVENVNSTVTANSDSILFVGRLAEKKGVQYLLPAFKSLLDSKPNASLTIAGDGPWLNRLKSQARELDLNGSVQFPGYVTGEAKRTLLESHTVYVVPSIITDSGDAEGLPVSLMEGLGAGLICIASNESGADDILDDGQDGFLVPERDEAALTQALLRAISFSVEQRRTIATAARKTAEQFSWPVIAKQHVDFLLKEAS